MTYKKLKELGYDHEDWKNWSDDQKVEMSHKGAEQPSGEAKKEKPSEKSTNSSTVKALRDPEQIPKRFFAGNRSITSYDIPKSVKKIGEDAFIGCSNLSQVTIPDSVTIIGQFAFSGCKSLKNVTIPKSVTSIGGDAFRGCDALTTVNWDAESADYTEGWPPFAYCRNLTTLNIGNNTKELDGTALSQLSALTTVTIGDNLAYISPYAFYDCPNIQSIQVSSNNTTYHSSDNCLIHTQDKVLVRGSKNSIIPDDGSVTSISESAFSHRDITSVSLPSSVVKIDQDAFNYCDKLTHVDLGDNISSIGESAFHGCSRLTSIAIPKSVTSIGMRAFAYTDVSDIEYTGTKKEWKRIKKGEGWLDSFAETKVIHCSDGDITL